MKALRFDRFGDVETVLHIEEVPDPVPQPDEVLVRVHAASINPSDVKNVQGKFPQTSLPRIPGRDLAGVVVAGNEGMIGQEVWASGGDIGFIRDGSHAEFIALPRRGARLKPKSLSMVEAGRVVVRLLVHRHCRRALLFPCQTFRTFFPSRAVGGMQEFVTEESEQDHAKS